MRKSFLKALVALLTMSQDDKLRPNWDRIIRIFSTLVTIGLIALYVHGKMTGRW